MAFTASSTGTTVNGVISSEVAKNIKHSDLGTLPVHKIDSKNYAVQAWNGNSLTMVNAATPIDAPERINVQVKPVFNIYSNVKGLPKRYMSDDLTGQNIYIKLDTNLIKTSKDAAGNQSRAVLPIRASLSLTLPNDIDTSSKEALDAISTLLGTMFQSDAKDTSDLKKLDQYRRNALTVQ